MKAALPALLLVALAACGRREEEWRVEQHLKTAVRLEEENCLDGAIAEYGKILQIVGTRDRWKTRAMEVRGIIKQLEEQKGQLAAAEAEFRSYQQRFRQITDAEAKDFERELKIFRERVKDSKLPWLPDLDRLLENTQARVDMK
jgi:hypothetical protein